MNPCSGLHIRTVWQKCPPTAYKLREALDMQRPCQSRPCLACFSSVKLRSNTSQLVPIPIARGTRQRTKSHAQRACMRTLDPSHLASVKLRSNPANNRPIIIMRSKGDHTNATEPDRLNGLTRAHRTPSRCMQASRTSPPEVCKGFACTPRKVQAHTVPPSTPRGLYGEVRNKLP